MAVSREDTSRYDDIIALPHHVSTRRPHMPMADRAAQFSPFAALTGYGAVIKETARLTDRMPELTEGEKALLDAKLRLACAGPSGRPEVQITYFVPDEKKEGGAFQTISGWIKRFDADTRQIVFDHGASIEIDRVLEIEQAGPNREVPSGCPQNRITCEQRCMKMPCAPASDRI